MSVRIITGHVLEALRGMASESIHCVVTSPPYFGLRDYGIEPQMWGGAPGCEHEWGPQQVKYGGGGQPGEKVRWQHTGEDVKGHAPANAGKFCQKCGAWLGNLGLENTLDLYLDHLVEICREIRRVLRRDGTFWLNISDAFAGSWGAQSRQETPATLSRNQINNHPKAAAHTGSIRAAGLKPKDLMLIPSRLCIRLQDDGWWVRQINYWCKRAPMPESCTDRSTSAVEWVIHLTKSGDPTYWTHRDHAGSRTKPTPDYRWVDHDNDDAETDGEPENWRTELAAQKPRFTRGAQSASARTLGFEDHGHRDHSGDFPTGPSHGKRWSRINLWTAHDYFYDAEAVKENAAYPDGPRAPDTIKSPYGQGFSRRAPSINENRKALRSDIESRHRSSIDGGQSMQAQPNGKRNQRNWWLLGPEPFPSAHFAVFPSEIPRRAILAGTSERGVCPKCGAPWGRVIAKQKFDRTNDRLYGGTLGHNPSGTILQSNTRGMPDPEVETIGWRPTCSCDAGAPMPATVLDPFAGAFTTSLVAEQLQHDSIAIELNQAYVEMGKDRLKKDGALFLRVDEESMFRLWPSQERPALPPRNRGHV